MANILDYIEWRGDISFKNAPFNEVDNLIFSQLSYMNFDGIVPGRRSEKTIALKDAVTKYVKLYPDPSDENLPVVQRMLYPLIVAMAGSVRFSGCRLARYTYEKDDEAESQFAAVVILMEDGDSYISFSGTDNTIVGWKENFNMCFMDETPGQLKAVRYVEKIIPLLGESVRMGGHSKGGNLAVYAATHVSEELQKKITEIYNNDGPGFKKRVLEQANYTNVLPKIKTYLPQSSVVGMLMNHKESYEVVSSTKRTGISQHDVITWEIIGPKFVHLDQLERESILLDKTVEQWFESVSDEQRQNFVEAMFEVLDNAGITDADDFRKITPVMLAELVKGVRGLDAEERKCMLGVIKIFIGLAKDNAEEALRHRATSKRAHVDESFA